MEEKPCPFCGGTKKHEDGCYIPMLVDYIQTMGTSCTEHELTEAWSARHEPGCDGCAHIGDVFRECCDCSRSHADHYMPRVVE